MSSLPRETADRHSSRPDAPLVDGRGCSWRSAFGLAGGYLDLLIIVLAQVLLESGGVLPHRARFPLDRAGGTRPSAADSRLGGCRGESAAAKHLAARGVLALRVAGDLGGTVAGAAVRCLYAASGCRVGSRDWRRGRILWPARRASCDTPLAACWACWEFLRPSRRDGKPSASAFAVAGLPRPSAGARNVVLIVWDTVSAYHVGAYGYSRNTTPNLDQWARTGRPVQACGSRRHRGPTLRTPASSPANGLSSSIPSGSPCSIRPRRRSPNISPRRAIRPPDSRRIRTAARYETGLARGFAHYEDYSLRPWSLLSRTVPGNWLLAKALNVGPLIGLNFDTFYAKKWINLQSQGEREISDRFLGWLGHRRPDRPFFAYLNYFDAHEPFVPPAGFENGFGVRPRTAADYQFLFDYVGVVKDAARQRDLKMARDCYDDCIAFLDEQLGQLLDTLKGQGLLENTAVIITSDHGEAFGDHGVIGHSYTVNLDEVGVPLVILAPECAGGPSCQQPREPARPAFDRGRSRGPVGGGTVPGALVDGRLEGAIRADSPAESLPRPSRNGPIGLLSKSTRQSFFQPAGSRCPWWPQTSTTFETLSASMPRGSRRRASGSIRAASGRRGGAYLREYRTCAGAGPWTSRR